MTKKKIFWKRWFQKYCWHKITQAHIHFLNGDIVEEERDDIVFFWHTMIVKWVHGECHHLCKLCDYKHECWSNAKE